LSLDEIRSDIEASLGTKDRVYIERAIGFHVASKLPPG